MIADARSVAQEDVIDTDVCVVGAGVAGLTLARELSGRGLQVLVLESGALTLDDDTQALYRGEGVGLPYYPLHEARARYCGGSANFWDIDLGDGRLGVRLRPPDPIDFEARDCVPHSGWPFDRAHLDPFYERAQALFDIEEPSYAPEKWDVVDNRLLFGPETAETVIFKFGAQDVFLKRRDEVVRRADDVIVLVHANVVDIETDASGQVVRRVHVACLRGPRFSVGAKVFVLAVGGIETPRLMLASNKVHPDGLGNRYDLVGRFFMEHLHFTSGIFVPARADMAASLPLYDRIHVVNGVPIVGKLALCEAVVRRERLLNQNIQLLPWRTTAAGLYPAVVAKATDSARVIVSAASRGQFPARFGGHVANVVRGLDDVATLVYRKLRRTLAGRDDARTVRVFRLAHMSEQVPNPSSRVSLAAERDALGQNRARLDWRLSPIDILSVRETQRILDTALRRAGLGELRTELRDETPPLGPVPIGVHGGYHHMGTTRMHRDPRHGVVDPDCRVHGIANLFVAGPSVFPTGGGYANPVLTVVALSLRLADHLTAMMKAAA